MTIPGTVSLAPVGLGFDTDTVVTAEVARQMASLGYRFCMRYLSLGEESSGDLTVDEAQGILAAGLALGLVQHATTSSLNASLGQENGANAAKNASGLGIPSGVTVWCDLESVHSSSSADTIAYVNAWASQVDSGGYEPGLYVGPDTGLNSTQLYESLSVAHYWKSGSEVPWVETRGFQMIQGLHNENLPISVDPDIACYDNMRDRFNLLMPQ
ncbi:MAG: DUF1906 domain-containing protein [Myxococcota bacterium]